MESVASKWQETLGELRGVQTEIESFVRGETKGWKRFFTLRATQVRVEARALFSAPAIEKRVLTQVDAALRSIDAKVRARLSELETPAKKRANGAAKSRATKRAVATKGSGRGSTIAGTAPAIRH